MASAVDRTSALYDRNEKFGTSKFCSGLQYTKQDQGLSIVCKLDQVRQPHTVETQSELDGGLFVSTNIHDPRATSAPSVGCFRTKLMTTTQRRWISLLGRRSLADFAHEALLRLRGMEDMQGSEEA